MSAVDSTMAENVATDLQRNRAQPEKAADMTTAERKAALEALRLQVEALLQEIADLLTPPSDSLV